MRAVVMIAVLLCACAGPRIDAPAEHEREQHCAQGCVLVPTTLWGQIVNYLYRAGALR